MPSDRPRCGAKLRGPRAGRTCRNRAGQRTPWDGVPGAKCWMHGGAAAAANLKHGRYSTAALTSLREMLATHAHESVSRAEVTALVEALAQVVAAHVTDPVLLAKIRSEWQRVASSAVLPGFLAHDRAGRRPHQKAPA